MPFGIFVLSLVSMLLAYVKVKRSPLNFEKRLQLYDLLLKCITSIGVVVAGSFAVFQYIDQQDRAMIQRQYEFERRGLDDMASVYGELLESAAIMAGASTLKPDPTANAEDKARIRDEHRGVKEIQPDLFQQVAELPERRGGSGSDRVRARSRSLVQHQRRPTGRPREVYSCAVRCVSQTDKSSARSARHDEMNRSRKERASLVVRFPASRASPNRSARGSGADGRRDPAGITSPSIWRVLSKAATAGRPRRAGSRPARQPRRIAGCRRPGGRSFRNNRDDR